MKLVRWIVFDGLPGAGKSTLLAELGRRGGFETATEPCDGWDDALAAFTNEPCTETAFRLQSTVTQVLGKELPWMKTNDEQKPTFSTTPTFIERDEMSADTFCRAMFSSGLLDADALQRLRAQRKSIFGNDPPDRLRVYVDVPPQIALSRMQERDRESERGTGLDYLTRLRDEHVDNMQFDLVVDGLRPPADIAETVLSWLESRRHNSAQEGTGTIEVVTN